MHKRVVESVGGDQSLDLPSKARKPVVEYAGEEYSIVCNNVRTDRLSEWMGQKKKCWASRPKTHLFPWQFLFAKAKREVFHQVAQAYKILFASNATYLLYVIHTMCLVSNWTRERTTYFDQITFDSF